MNTKLMRAAFDKSAEINSSPNKWSTVTVSDRVIVEWGYIKFNGHQESKIQTIVFHLSKDGTVVTSEHTHS